MSLISNWEKGKMLADMVDKKTLSDSLTFSSFIQNTRELTMPEHFLVLFGLQGTGSCFGGSNNNLDIVANLVLRGE